MILASTQLKIGYQKMMARHFRGGTGYEKKEWKNFGDWYNSLEPKLRTDMYEKFMSAINDEKKSNSIEILQDTTTME